MSLPGELQVVEHVPQAFADFVARHTPHTIALSGGDTARKCYELLAVADVDWPEVAVLFGDERWVPVGDPDSNEGMARFAFIDQVLPREVYSLRHAGDTPETAAAAYEHVLRELGSIDLVHLGLGPDGHTASLFPGSPALGERQRLVVPTGDDQHPHPRLTFTYPALELARTIVFTVAGDGKRDALARIRAGDDLPASRVRAERVVWLVDEAALGATDE
ncbi:MAG TPA: 6-phosphogluconolactonase [Acidimicrobiia bacterium]